jgi:RimJ/RimL family protein N-acetyltransferase
VDLYVLNDGRTVGLRPVRPDDAPRLRAHHVGLSDQSRYQRFLGAKPRLSDADTRYLADVDGSDHFALVATRPADDDGHAGEAIVGVARFVRNQGDPHGAEFAIVVSDAYQRQGLARALMERLAAAAQQRGIRRFRAVLLPENVAVRRLMAHLADGPVTVLRQGPVLELEIELVRAREPAVTPDLGDAGAQLRIARRAPALR